MSKVNYTLFERRLKKHKLDGLDTLINFVGEYMTEDMHQKSLEVLTPDQKAKLDWIKRRK